MPVAVQLAELAADQLHVVAEQRPLRVAGDLHRLPGAQVVVGLAEQGGVVRAKLAKLFRIIHTLVGLEGLQLLDLLLEGRQRLFKVQDVAEGGPRGAGSLRSARPVEPIRPARASAYSVGVRTGGRI